jgi:acyl carrier protein
MAIERADQARANMTGNHLNVQIREFILEKFPLARKQQLKDTDALLETGILDSLGVLDLVSYMEQKFSIVVADDELVPENFQSVATMAAYVQRKTSERLVS